jgi:phenylalanyl-tRNA synthetase beta chain
MLLSRDWLSQYTKIPKNLSDKDLGSLLTLSVVEVEGFNQEGKNLDKIVVGKVLEIEPHPNADKLKIVEVDLGKEKIKAVCGGQNLEKGMLVAFAKVGAKVRWHGENKWTELAPAEIRGVESCGMICAAEELGLEPSLNPEHGILDISATKAKPGEPFAKAFSLNDTVFDIDNKSITHRPDLWGHYGMARELAALFDEKLKDLEIASIEKGNNKMLSVDVKDFDLCPRYCGLVIDNIVVGPSPMWMQKRLSSAGVRPINNIVDITNYVLLELGQPMHAFDYSFIPDGKIIVRRAKDREEITTLDDEKRVLTKDMLVIANVRGAVAVAGVMGGANSEINDRTTSIILESANFNPYSIRKTSVDLGLRTESSARFEKSLDPNMAMTGILRAVKLIMEICLGAKVASPLVDQSKFKLNIGPINLDLDFLNRKIGVEVPKKQVIQILSGLGFEISDQGKALSVKVPTWRATKDISIPEDLVEEVARIYGYNNITPELPEFEIKPPEENKMLKLEKQIINIMVGLGVSEAYNYSFVSEKDLDQLGIDKSNCIRVKNPMNEEQALIRPKLLPNILKNIITNQRNYSEIALFEIGNIHFQGESKRFSNPKKKTYLPEEITNLAGVFVKRGSANQFEKAADIAKNLMLALGLNSNLQEEKGACAYCHPARRAILQVNDRVIGEVLELHPAKQKTLGIDERVGYFEINLEELLEILQKQETGFTSLPKFPSVRRDLALVCPEELNYAELEKGILGASNLVVKVELFDIYRGKGLPEGTKSMALHLEFRDLNKTLEADEIEKEMSNILKSLESKDVKLR